MPIQISDHVSAKEILQKKVSLLLNKEEPSIKIFVR